MSASMGGSQNRDVELNITPIIDCFTVLITFMLASASFISIGFFEASTPGNTTEAQTKEPEIEAILHLKNNHLLNLKVKGKMNYSLSFNYENKDDFKKIDDELLKLKKGEYQISSILMTADDEVDYQSMTQIMDHLNQADLPVIVGDFGS